MRPVHQTRSLYESFSRKNTPHSFPPFASGRCRFECEEWRRMYACATHRCAHAFRRVHKAPTGSVPCVDANFPSVPQLAQMTLTLSVLCTLQPLQSCISCTPIAAAFKRRFYISCLLYGFRFEAIYLFFCSRTYHQSSIPTPEISIFTMPSKSPITVPQLLS